MKKMKKSDMIVAFQVYKDGVTSQWISILCPIEEFNNEWLSKKIAKYISLGYIVSII